MTRYIYIYTRKGTLLSGVAYPHIDIGLIESYPRGTSCRGDTCRSFIKDRQNKSRVKGLLVPYGTIELAQLAPSSTAMIFSSTRTRIHGVLPACSSSPTLPIKKNRRSSLNNPTDSQVLRDLKKKNHIFDNFQRATHFIIPLKKYVSNFSRPKRLLSDFTSLENTSPRKGDNLLSRYRHVRVNIS